MKHFAHFDEQNCFFDDEGMPHLRRHTCGTCGYSCQPEDQSLFTDDDGEPEGVVAMTTCPKCSSGIMSAVGTPEFMMWFAVEIPSLSSQEPVAVEALFAPAPLATAVSGRRH